MSSFIEIKDANVQLIDGDRGTNYPEKSDFHQNGFCLFLDASNITDSGFDFESTHFISKLKDAQLKNGKLRRYDIVLMTRGSVGNVALYDDDIRYENIRINSGMLILRCENRSNAEKLLYLFRSKLIKTQISNLQSGSIQKQLPVVALKMLKIPKKWERSNVSILQALDKKITLNKQINAELEALAKTIYDYWFVQFDFPDENGKPYRTSGGAMEWNELLKREIPKGWHADMLGSICKTKLGGTPSTDKPSYWNGTIPWLNSGEVASSPVLQSEKTITVDGMNESATSFAHAGAVVMSITRYIRPAILGIDACFNQSVVAVIPNEKYETEFLYPLMLSQVGTYMGLRTGAQQPHINKETVDSTMVCCPSESILSAYCSITRPLFNLQQVKAIEIIELTRLRDWLLPMLMNGQATVK